MLDRFKVPIEDQVRVPEDSLRETVTAVFEKMGESPEHAAAGADHLVAADLRGVESHGVSNMLRSYIEYYNEGKIRSDHRMRVVRESRGTAVLDADKGLAIILGPEAMQMAVDKARDVGVGIVTLINAGHSGAIGYHALHAAKQDMVGMCFTAGGTRVAPTFAAEGRLGTNPMAMAAPSRNEAPFLFDAATSSVAHNKIRLAQRVGANILPGWMAEEDGTPIMEEVPPPDSDIPLLLPLGGTRELGSHKGYGLGMMAEILTTLLSGVGSGMVDGESAARHYFAAYNIEAFTDLDQFKDNMDAMLKTLRTTPPAAGHERVLYPGLLEHEAEQDRRANGIPLHREVVKWFQDIAGEFSIPALRTL